MSKVFLKKQNTYLVEELIEAVDAIFTAFGLYDKITPGRKVLLKPNLILRSAPEEAMITHPNLVAAVAVCVQKHGGKVLVAESGGGVYNPAVMKSVFRGCGYTAVAEKYGFELYTECKFKAVELPNGIRCGSLEVIEPYVRPHDAFVIDIAKLKTHGMLGYSGAVKNLFGVVPGLMKPELHCRYPEKSDFAEMIVDLCEYVQPDFSIIDGIEAMQGDGPTGGEKRFVGALIGSPSPYSADLVGMSIINIDPMDMEIHKKSHSRGLCGVGVSGVEIVGDSIESVFVKDFKRARSSDIDFVAHLPKFLQPIAKKITTPYPKIQKKNCIGCGKCAESCPQHTIAIEEKKAIIDYSKCIRCFCCHEMCPMHVIDIKRFSVFKL